MSDNNKKSVCLAHVIKIIACPISKHTHQVVFGSCCRTLLLLLLLLLYVCVFVVGSTDAEDMACIMAI